MANVLFISQPTILLSPLYTTQTPTSLTPGINCEAGKHGSTSPGAPTVGSCENCEAGKYSEQVGAFNEADTCLNCPTGYAQDKTGQAYCLPCVP